MFQLPALFSPYILIPSLALLPAVSQSYHVLYPCLEFSVLPIKLNIILKFKVVHFLSVDIVNMTLL